MVACGFLLPGVQANAIGSAVDLALGGGTLMQTPLGEISSVKLVVGSVIIVFLGIIIFGGVKRIAHFTQVVVPVMALLYVVSSLVIIGMNITLVPGEKQGTFTQWRGLLVTHQFGIMFDDVGQAVPGENLLP